MSEPTGTTPPAADPATPPVTPPPSTPPAATDGTDYKALAAQAQADAERWKAMSRKHEERAKANADAAAGAKTVEQQLEEMRKALAERDVADVSRSGRMAMTTVQARLAEHGFARADVAGLLELVDPVSLLKDGEPDESAIKKLADSLIKVGGRITPDPDQGRRGGKAPADMNSLIRRAAGHRS
jgi:hypothetical protein